MPRHIVIDSCVFNKLFLKEKDSAEFHNFLRYCADVDVDFHIPSIFSYEVLGVALANGLTEATAFALHKQVDEMGIRIHELTNDLIKSALGIANHGHPKTGYPSFYDACYHALAVNMGGIFLTSDHRHVSKTGDIGHVVLLRDWESLF